MGCVRKKKARDEMGRGGARGGIFEFDSDVASSSPPLSCAQEEWFYRVENELANPSNAYDSAIQLPRNP